MVLTNEEVDAAVKQPNENGFGKSRYDIARAIEAKIMERIGKPVAWLMLNKEHDFDPSLLFAPKTDWHISWEAVPLYKLPEVKG